MSKSCADLSVEEIEKAIEEKGLSFDNQDCVIALAQLYSVPLEELENIEEEGDDHYTVLGISYLAGTDGEMDTAWDEELDNYLEECVEGSQGQYFDTEAWKRDARMEGRGHALNRYDGEEDEIEVNGETYYSYRS